MSEFFEEYGWLAVSVIAGLFILTLFLTGIIGKDTMLGQLIIKTLKTVM